MTYLERLQLKDLPRGEEICRCSSLTTLHLRYEFSEFPIVCTECIGQIFPSALHLPDDLAQELVSWRTVYADLYDLWLDSSDYESFARRALLDPNGDVNRRGLALATKLSEQRLTSYWWFSDDADSASQQCPVCHAQMVEHATRRFRFCGPCRISC